MATARTDLEGDIVVDAIVPAAALQQFVDTLTPILDEAKLHFDENGIHVKGVDPANVAMVDMDLNVAAFESYDSGRVTVGVDLRRLDDRIGVANAGDLLHLRVDMEARVLELEIRHIEQSLRLIDPDAIRAEPGIPDLEDDMTTEAVLEGADFEEAVTVADMVSDHIFFRSDIETRTFEVGAKGDIDESVATFGDEELIGGSDFEESGNTLLSINYVKDFVKPIPTDAETTIRHGTEVPAFIEYEACEGNLSVTNLVAPRIQSE